MELGNASSAAHRLNTTITVAVTVTAVIVAVVVVVAVRGVTMASGCPASAAFRNIVTASSCRHRTSLYPCYNAHNASQFSL